MSLKISINDLGNSSTKANNQNFKKVRFNNIILSDVTSSMGRRVHDDITAQGIEFTEENYLKYLDVTIKQNGQLIGRFFVGDLAVDKDPDNAERRDLYIPKARAEQSFVCNCVASALNLLDFDKVEKYKKEKVVDFGQIVSGILLPTREMKESDLVDYVYENMIGDFEVTFNLGLFDGITVKYSVIEDYFFALPEGTIGIAGMHYDRNGNLLEKFVEQTKDKYLLGLDIGGHSTDAGTSLNQKPVPEYCFDVGIGLLTSIDEIVEDLKDEVKASYDIKVNPTKEEITEDIINKEFKFEYDTNKYLDTTPIVKGAFNRKIKPLVSNFTNKFKTNIDHKIYGIWVFGGGSILANETIKKRLEMRFPNKVHIIDNETLKIDGEYDPIWFNVENAVKYIKHKLVESEIEFEGSGKY